MRKLILAALPCLVLGLASPAFAHAGGHGGVASQDRNRDALSSEQHHLGGDTTAPGDMCPLAYDLSSTCLTKG